LDDPAVLDLGTSEHVIVTCDLQLEGRHFRRDWITPRQIGRRAAAVNLSDVAAMGGSPRAAVVSLLLPARLAVAEFDAILRGLGERLAEHGAALVGGNLARSRNLVSVDLTLLGTVSSAALVRRSGARPGDRILVTGWPGESAAGRALLSRAARKRRPIRKPAGPPDLAPTHARRLIRRHLDPSPRVREGQLLAAGGATAMIDASDGLAADLARLMAASRVGAEVDADRLPVSPALERAAAAIRFPAWRWTWDGGEDYELLCTAPPGRVAPLRDAIGEATGVPLTEIGVVRPAAHGAWLRRAGRRVRFAARGYDHFRRRGR
jgi:thiamine-monophosphate kinase